MISDGIRDTTYDPESRELDKDIPKSLVELYEMPWREYLRLKNYDTNVSNMCRNCQKEQIQKYGEITIKCRGPRSIDIVPEEIIQVMTQEELDKVKQSVDPYYWAEKNIDIFQKDPEKRLFSYRWHQDILLKCSSSKKAIRCGRRAGKSYGLSLDIFERMMNNPNYQVLVVTPFLSQAKELADTVRKLIRAVNPELGDWDSIVARSVTSPYQEIRFTNGSTFKAFTAGNDNANAVRGQGAHLIVIDEADFLSQEAFDSIMAILMDKPNTEIICTSTPMGENIMFKLSNSKDYKEFHFPSFVIPHYNDDMDQANRENLSINGYLQEIMALYSLDDRAVFQPDFINNAVNTNVSVPIYDVLSNRDNYIVSLGCDWNADRVGTRICVLAYSKSEGKMFIANMSNVRKEGWTQVAAIEKIVDLNRQYKPDYIYVDEGFGEANVQQLKLIALESYGKVPVNHPDLKLSEIVPINFASTLELKDAITGEIRKKYFKNFIVETTKRALEKGVLALADPVCESVIAQMRGYMIKSRIAGGREVYEPKTKELGDHDLDAFMLALCAIHMNEESILDTSILSNFTAIPMAKGNYEFTTNAKNIEGRRYTDEKPPSRRSLPKGVGSRSDLGIGSFGRSHDRAAAFGQMKRYRKNMNKSYSKK